MRFIYSYLKKYRGMIAAAMTIKSIAALGELMLPYVLEHMVDDVVPRKSGALLFGWGAVMILLAVFVRQANVRANRLSAKVAKEGIYEIRRDLFWKSLGLSGNQVDEFGLPSLNSRMTSDSYNVQNFIRSFQAMGVRAPILLIGGIAITLTMDVGLASVLCILAPVMVGLVVWVSWKGIPLYEKVQQCVDDIVRIMRENITGIRVVKALSKEDYEMRRFGAANEEMARKDIKAGIVMALPGPLMTFVLNVGLTIVVVVGAVRVDGGLTKPGVILAFLTYFNMISMGVMGLNRVFMMMSKANASADRIAAVVHAPDELVPLPEAEAAVTEREDYIVFDHVGFNYGRSQKEASVDQFDGQGRQKSLDDIDFSMKKGGTLGIIGATGCGKTTIINLLMRFYDADEGAVFIDGKDVRTYDKDALHRMFGVVFQNDVIFADSLKENIAFGRDVSPEQMDAAAADARARDFIREYEDTYEHKAVVRGANLSGGQRQRVLIARALAAAPEILILDDSSSALDYKTDAALRKAIREHHGDTTTIIVAQRISSIMSLDDIIVLEEGRIIGHGTHEELMESCPMYQEIHRIQMGA
ncbi:MAG: ABC transporter ATP-binding protein [Lachnospiraceae bacterium]|nr:ABC transporter ATP-binding protein [Lachnospiraceae bacterium]